RCATAFWVRPCSPPLALTMVSLDRCPRNPGESTAAEFHSQLWPVHEKRGVLAAFGAGACEGDHVMGDDPDMDQLLDASSAWRGPAHSPESAAVVAEQPDANQQSRHDADRAAQIAGIEAGAGQWQGDPVDVGVRRIPDKAAIDRLRAVGMTYRAPPTLQNLVIGAGQNDVLLPGPLFPGPSRRPPPVPPNGAWPGPQP